MKNLQTMGKLVVNEIKDTKNGAKRLLTVVQYTERYGVTAIDSETNFWVKPDFVAPPAGSDVMVTVSVNKQYLNLHEITQI